MQPLVMCMNAMRQLRYVNGQAKQRLDTLAQLLATLIVASQPQTYLLDPSRMEVEDELVEGDSLVDWDSLLIYDIYSNEEDLVEEVSVLADTIKIVQENDTHHVFDETPNGEVPLWGLEKINCRFFWGRNFFVNFS